MEDNFNKQVFESFPDSVWTGGMPEFDCHQDGKASSGRHMVNVAAALCVPLLAAVLVLSFHRNDAVPESGSIAQSEIVYRVNSATRADIVLPDSTLVTLNSGSTLRLATDFGTGSRTVELDGEGYFDVHHDRSVPFLINTPQGIQVKVTGTKFNMSCYSDNPKFDLTLIQGSVEVKTPKNEVLHVQPSEHVLVKDDFHNIAKVEAPEDALVWKDGVLKFDRTTMREALVRIENWYGVRINVEDERIYENSISAEFHSETLKEVLQLICISSRLEYSIENDEVSLRTKS